MKQRHSHDRMLRGRRAHGLLWGFAYAILFLCASGAGLAVEPGPRILGHAKLDCQKCHTSGSGISNSKCLSCHEHKPLQRRIKAKKGLHARSKFKSKTCESCHSEHKGRKYNPIDWKPVGSKKRFNHDLTGYDLEGAHRRLDCKQCHTAKYKKSKRTKYLGLDQDCLSCHEDVHRFQRTNKSLLDCTVCHSFDARTVSRAKGLTRFNHKKSSRFALNGPHKETKCVKCHSSTKSFKMETRPNRCADCHEDVHKDLYTAKKRDCNACHSDRQSSFSTRIPRFDHDRDTSFTLIGAHKKQSCRKCHVKGKSKSPKTSCVSCHLKDSAHVAGGQDRFKGRNCADCHGNTEFSKNVTFDHTKETAFELGGKHGTLSCTECHRRKPKAEVKTPEDTFEFFASNSCIGCHAHLDEHGSAFNDRPKICIKCHIPGSTNIKKPKHSELTPHFAQQGAHAALDCAKCHGNALSNLTPGNDCSACHEKDDAHEGNLGFTCKNCHLEGFPWTQVLFQHNTQASYALEGKHQAVACDKCHTNAPRVYKPLKTDCISCHQDQDVHKNKLGQDCAKCHDMYGATSFFSHNRMTPYILEGAHARADCTGCHYEGEAKSQKIDYLFSVPGMLCRDCHGDPHGLRPGATCTGCHDLEDFQNAVGKIGAGDNHEANTNVPDPDGGAGEQALAKPRNHSPKDAETLKDNMHERPSLLIKTSERRDRYHDVPPFSLRGGHSRIECFRCHGGKGDMQGFGKMCSSCHLQDDIHAGSLGPTCGDCHSVERFTPARFSHTNVGFTLVASHRLLSCKQCHGAGNYMGLSGDCISCHLDDAFRANSTAGVNHEASFVTQPCINCHNQISWTLSPFLRRRY
jgi:hypothetical protein